MTAPLPGPVIILGMHRSGTSVLARSLSSLGLFLGARVQRNEEAVLFRRYNDHLFTLAGARWDHPGPARIWEAEDGPGAGVERRLADAIASYQCASYLGARRYLKYRGLETISEPWGWKDPRNTFLVDLWLRIFPGARVIHLIRHGVDVAASLRRRHQRYLDVYRDGSIRGLSALRSPPNPAVSLRCGSLQGGFTLWKEYVTQGRMALERATRDHPVLDLRFETLTQDPRESLTRVSEFAGLSPAPERLEAAARTIEAGPAESWKRDPELRSFAATVREPLDSEGYEG